MLGAEGCLGSLLREPQQIKEGDGEGGKTEEGEGLSEGCCDIDMASVCQLREFWENVVADKNIQSSAICVWVWAASARDVWVAWQKMCVMKSAMFSAMLLPSI